MVFDLLKVPPRNDLVTHQPEEELRTPVCWPVDLALGSGIPGKKQRYLYSGAASHLADLGQVTAFPQLLSFPHEERKGVVWTHEPSFSHVLNWSTQAPSVFP